MTIEWFEVSSGGRRIPAWMRQAARDSDGTIYLPPAIAGVSEMEMLLCAGYDGIQAILDGKHAYYPADWIAREFPIAAPTVARIKERLKDQA
jgi:hypothetical protein